MIELKYIELHAKNLVCDLSKSWDEEKLCELHETISDFFAVKKRISTTKTESQSQEIDRIVFIKNENKPKKRNPYQPVGTRQAVMELILDLLESSVKSGKKECHIKAKDFGVTVSWMESSVIKHINFLIERTGRFPNLRVSYRVDNKGGFWLFPKAESLL